MAFEHCIDAIMKATGDQLGRNEADKVLQQVADQRDRLIQQGRSGQFSDLLRRVAEAKARDEQFQKALARKQAVVTALKREQVITRVNSWMAQGILPQKALLMLFEGSVRNLEEGRFSVMAQKLGLEGRYIGSMFAEIELADPTIWKELVPGLTDDIVRAGRALTMMDIHTPTRPLPFLDDVVREMTAMKGGRIMKATDNVRAQKVAEIFWKYSEIARRDANRNGAGIRSLDGWGGPHHYDSDRLMNIGREQFVERTLQRLDLDRTFAALGVDPSDGAEMRKVLGEIYTTLVTGRDREATPAERGQTTGPANLAKQLAKHRVLHYRDADSWLAQNAEFGHGHIFNAMISHQQRMAQANALMSILGPNPEATLKSITERMDKQINRGAPVITPALQRRLDKNPERRAWILDKAKIDQSDGLGHVRSKVNDALQIAIGQTAVSGKVAGFGRVVRAHQSLTKLGAAVWSGTTDLVTTATNLHYQGKPLFAAYADQIREAVKGRGTRGQERAMSYYLGEGFDGMTDSIVTPWVAEDAIPGRAHILMTSFFKWSQLTWWTDTRRAGGARIMAADMGRQSNRAWGSLDPRYRRVLRQHGIDEMRWDMIRDTAYTAENGNRYVTPDKIQHVTDDKLHPLIADRLNLLETGLAQREAQRQAHDAKEQDWIDNRARKLRSAFADARDVLQKRFDQADEKGKAKIGALQAQLDSLAGDVSDMREIYAGTRPSMEGERFGYAGEVARETGLLANEVGQMIRQASPQDHAAWRKTESAVKRAAQAVQALTGEERPTLKSVGEQIGEALDALDLQRAKADQWPGVGDRIDQLRERLETAALQLQPGPSPRQMGRAEGRAQALAVELRAKVEAIKRAVEGQGKTLGEEFQARWQDRQDELMAFIDRSEERQRMRAEASKADVAAQAGRIARLYEDARFDLEMSLRRFISDEINFAVIESDPVTRRLSTGNTPAGTLHGEAMRLVMQFKGYPLAFTQRVLGRAILGYSGTTAERLLASGGHFAALLAGLTVMGYASMTAKDLLRGFSPKDPTKAASIQAALLQSGGLGIFGDFLFAELSRFGNTELETAAGPAFGTASNLLTFGKQVVAGQASWKRALDLAIQNIPLVNLWYVKAALNLLWLNDLREGLQPGYLSRQARTAKQTYGQERWF